MPKVQLGDFVVREYLAGFAKDNKGFLPNARAAGARHAGGRQCRRNRGKKLLTPKETGEGVIGKKNILKNFVCKWGLSGFLKTRVLNIFPLL